VPCQACGAFTVGDLGTQIWEFYQEPCHDEGNYKNSLTWSERVTLVRVYAFIGTLMCVIAHAHPNRAKFKLSELRLGVEAFRERSDDPIGSD